MRVGREQTVIFAWFHLVLRWGGGGEDPLRSGCSMWERKKTLWMNLSRIRIIIKFYSNISAVMFTAQHKQSRRKEKKFKKCIILIFKKYCLNRFRRPLYWETAECVPSKDLIINRSYIYICLTQIQIRKFNLSQFDLSLFLPHIGVKK